MKAKEVRNTKQKNNKMPVAVVHKMIKHAKIIDADKIDTVKEEHAFE